MPLRVLGSEIILFEYDGAWLEELDRFSLEPALSLACLVRERLSASPSVRFSWLCKACWRGDIGNQDQLGSRVSGILRATRPGFDCSALWPGQANAKARHQQGESSGRWHRGLIMATGTTEFDAAKYLSSPEAQAVLLSDALETGDAGYIGN